MTPTQEEAACSYLPRVTLDPRQAALRFAYAANRSVDDDDDDINMALHFIHQHQDSAATHARILFVDFCSAFIIPDLLPNFLN